MAPTAGAGHANAQRPGQPRITVTGTLQNDRIQQLTDMLVELQNPPCTTFAQALPRLV